MNDSPIFIHSLFRAGSTYLFNVFRRSERGYWCYQEPLHELAAYCRENPSGLLEDHIEALAPLLRHPQVEGAYFKELQETWPAWKDVISEQIIYDAYFADRNEDIGIAYWCALAEAAHGRPVFQECRTAGRIGAIKSGMGGDHIFLWRNPWDQWWSYKVTPYFDVVNQLIIHACRAPQPVRLLLAALDLPVYEYDDLAGTFAFYGEKPLTSEQSYLVFYLLWCLALREGMAHADLMLNVDRLSDSVDYQSEMQDWLEEAGIAGIDFSDCRIPQGRYLERERAFFDTLEAQVHQWLVKGGWTQQDIDRIQTLRQQYQPVAWPTPITDLAPADLTEQASRARELAIRLETTLAERTRSDNGKLSEAESKVELAEAKAQQAESAAQSAESRAQQAESAAQSAESRAQQAESAAQSAENRAQQAESASHQAWMQLQAVSASTSWRITAPLRAFKRILTGDLSPNSRIAISFRSALSNLPGARKTYDLIRDPVGHGIRFVARRPVLKRRLRSYIRQFPAVENWLLERRAAQLRADFSRAWSEKGVVPGSPQATNADFSFKANSQVGQRSVDAILERIRAERRKINGD